LLEKKECLGVSTPSEDKQINEPQNQQKKKTTNGKKVTAKKTTLPLNFNFGIPTKRKQRILKQTLHQVFRNVVVSNGCRGKKRGRGGLVVVYRNTGGVVNCRCFLRVS